MNDFIKLLCLYRKSKFAENISDVVEHAADGVDLSF
jgi:hypothetical protein